MRPKENKAIQQLYIGLCIRRRAVCIWIEEVVCLQEMVIPERKHTKVMQNSQSAKYKFSSLEKLMNHSILIIVVLQITIATISGYYGADWIKGNETRYDYLQLEG